MSRFFIAVFSEYFSVHWLSEWMNKCPMAIYKCPMATLLHEEINWLLRIIFNISQYQITVFSASLLIHLLQIIYIPSPGQITFKEDKEKTL